MIWKRLSATVISLLILLPYSGEAAEIAGPITRRDGFLMLWQSIHRPVESVREHPFKDVPEGSAGFLEIRYAKARGLLDDEDFFHPDDPLLGRDALLWLFRTRNVDDLKLLTSDALSELVTRFSIKNIDQDKSLTEEELSSLMQNFDAVLKRQEHEVSLYGEKWQGHGTAFGELFNMYDLTAAHRTYPYNTLVRVTNVANGKSVIVRINDRGPFVKGRDMDLSLTAFETIEDRSKGKFTATFERLGDVNLVSDSNIEESKSSEGNCVVAPRYQRIALRGVSFQPGIPRQGLVGQAVTFTSKHSFIVSVIPPYGVGVVSKKTYSPGQAFTFTPPMEGVYVLVVGADDGRTRRVRMRATPCSP